MDKELLDKEVLCIFDTRKIQRYIFRSNSFADTIGASDIVKHILDDAILNALKTVEPALPESSWDLATDPDAPIPYFDSDEIQFQLISSSSGNAICIVRTGSLCQKIIRKVSVWYLRHGYSLDLACAVTEKTEDPAADMFRLFLALNENKGSAESLAPAPPLPVVVKEDRTGEPCIGVDEEGRYYSSASLIRRREASERDLIVGMDDLNTTRAFNGKEYVAIIHTDGNNLGITISRILFNRNDYIESIRARRRITKKISEVYKKICDRTIEDLKDFFDRKKDPDKGTFDQNFYLVHQGGDDVNCICNADLAVPFLKFFYKNLEGKYLWESEDFKVPLYVCSGVAFVTKGISFHVAFHKASECCDNAKSVAKEERNLKAGLASNWMDFQILDNSDTQELDVLRKRIYVTGERVRLLLRPYSLDPSDLDKPYSYNNLLNSAKAIKAMDLPRTSQEMMRLSYSIGRTEFRKWISDMKEEGTDLTAKLGKPLYEDMDRISHATWFDACELSDFIPDDLEGC